MEEIENMFKNAEIVDSIPIRQGTMVRRVIKFLDNLKSGETKRIECINEKNRDRIKEAMKRHGKKIGDFTIASRKENDKFYVYIKKNSS